MSDSLRLAVFIPTLDGGGAERVVLALAGAFAREGATVDLVLTRRTGAFVDQIPPDVRVVDFDRQRTVATLPALVRYLRRAQPDVLVTALRSATVVGAVAHWLSGSSSALCATVHNVPARLAGRAGLWGRALLTLFPRALRRADAVVAVSRAVASSLLTSTGLDPARLHVIHNPIDVDAARAGQDAPPPHPWLAAEGSPRVPVLLGAGRLCPQKDFATLLRAAAILRRDRPVRVLIVGEGDARSALEALARELGIDDDVALPGFVDDPFAFMAHADAFALSSAWEPFGNVVVEAMATGTPVVVTAAGGASEIVRDPTATPPIDVGPVVPPGDPAALAHALASVIDAPPDASTLQRRAAAFDVPVAVDAYRRLFTALCSPSSHSVSASV